MTDAIGQERLERAETADLVDELTEHTLEARRREQRLFVAQQLAEHRPQLVGCARGALDALDEPALHALLQRDVVDCGERGHAAAPRRTDTRPTRCTSTDAGRAIGSRQPRREHAGVDRAEDRRLDRHPREHRDVEHVADFLLAE